MLQSVIILIIILFIFLLYWYNTGRKLNIGSYVLLLYIISLSSSFLLDQDHLSFSFEASLYFLFVLLLFLSPLLFFNSNGILHIPKVNLKLFNLISYIFIFLGILTYIYFVPVIWDILQLDKSIIALRTAMVGGEVYHNSGIIFYIVSLFCQFYPIVIVFYFYSALFTENSRLFNFLLLFSSTGYIINVLASIGRDGFVLWSMSYVFALLLFRKFMDSKLKKFYKKLIYSLGILFSLFFIPITISRFAKDGNFWAAVESIFSYLGQQFGNFNDRYVTITNNVWEQESIDQLFPILALGKKESVDILSNNEHYLYLFNIDINVFSTFIGSFIKAINPITLLFIALIYALFFSLLFFRSKYVSLGRLLLVVLVAQIPLHGLFYYKLSYLTSNIYIIGVLILSLLFWRKTNFKKEFFKGSN